MSTLPTRINLADYSIPDFNQGDQNTCTASVVTQAIRIQAHEYGLKVSELAVDALFYNALYLYQGSQAPTFTNINSTEWSLKAAMQMGVNTQAFATSQGQPYLSSNVIPPAPTQAMVNDALNHRITGYTNLNVNSLSDTKLHDTIVSELVKGKPVMLGVVLPNWMTSVEYYENGVHYMVPNSVDSSLTPDQAFKKLADMHMKAEATSPATNNAQYEGPNVSGGHTLLIVGYDQTLFNNKGGYIVENPWGPGVGYKGYQVIPSDFRSQGMSLKEMQTLDGFQGVDQAWTANRDLTAMAYHSVLNRAADHDGLVFWSKALDSGISLADVTNALYNSAEGQALYANMDDTAFVNKIFTDIKGRVATASEMAVEKVILEHTTRGQEIYSLMWNVHNHTGVNQSEYDRFANRTQVSETFALTYNANGHENIAYAALNGGTVEGVSFTAVTSNADQIPITMIGIHDALHYT